MISMAQCSPLSQVNCRSISAPAPPHSVTRLDVRSLMPRLGQRPRDVARVNHAGVFGPRAVVGQVHSGVADAGQVLQFEHHGLCIGLGDHGGQGEGGGGHGLSVYGARSGCAVARPDVDVVAVPPLAQSLYQSGFAIGQMPVGHHHFVRHDLQFHLQIGVCDFAQQRVAGGWLRAVERGQLTGAVGGVTTRAKVAG